MLIWGKGDTYSPDNTMTITARAMGLPLAPPVVQAITGMSTIARPVSANRTGGDGPSRTAACFQYQTDGSYDGHFVSTRNPGAIADWTAFLTSAVGAGTPRVP